MILKNKILSIATVLTLASSAYGMDEVGIVHDAPTTIAQQLKEVQEWAAQNAHRALEAAKISKDYVKFGYDALGILEEIKKNLEDTIYDRWFGGETGKYARKAVEQCLPALPNFQWLLNYSASWDLGCISNILVDAILNTQAKEINQAKTDVIGWVFGDEEQNVNIKGNNRRAGQVVNTYHLTAENTPALENVGFVSNKIPLGASGSNYAPDDNKRSKESENAATVGALTKAGTESFASQQRIYSTTGRTYTNEEEKDIKQTVERITKDEMPVDERNKIIADFENKHPSIPLMPFITGKQGIQTASGNNGEKYILGSSYIIVPGVENSGQDNIVNYSLNVLPENDYSRTTARDLVKKTIDGIKKSKAVVQEQNPNVKASGFDPANLTEFMQKYINTATTSLLAYQTGEVAMISFENTQKGKAEEAKNAKEGEPKIDDREKIAADMLQTRAIVSQLLIMNQAIHSLHESLQSEIAISTKENKEILVEILNKQDITNGILRDLVGELKTLNAIMSKK